MMAVFRTQSSSTGTWWYPFLKSSFVNTLQPCSLLVRSAILGHVYLLGVVWRLSLLKPPQGRHVPSGFFTMCSGDDQLLDDLLMIPCFSSSANSTFAAAKRSGSNRLYLLETGHPVVSITCFTSQMAGGNCLLGLNTAGKAESRA